MVICAGLDGSIVLLLGPKFLSIGFESRRKEAQDDELTLIPLNLTLIVYLIGQILDV